MVAFVLKFTSGLVVPIRSTIIERCIVDVRLDGPLVALFLFPIGIAPRFVAGIGHADVVVRLIIELGGEEWLARVSPFAVNLQFVCCFLCVFERVIFVWEVVQ